MWTSYLAIENPASPGAFRQYEVRYDTSLFADPSQISGADLLDCVFGDAAPAGTYSDAFGGTYALSVAGTADESVSYIDFFGSPFAQAFTIGGTEYAQDVDYNPSWSYYVAGGAGGNATGAGPGSYGAGTWSFANDGLVTRYVSEGSYDAWVLSPIDPFSFLATASPSVSPVADDFLGATVILHSEIPEPGRVALLLVAGVLFLGRRQR